MFLRKFLELGLGLGCIMVVIWFFIKLCLICLELFVKLLGCFLLVECNNNVVEFIVL